MTTQQRLDLGSARPTDERVVDVDIAERMEQAFLDYSMSVIVGRALPDVRDGLKPVQRRILYAMWEAGLRPERPYRKCASAVGDVMKKYHPHGDASIYDALVRMAQDFSTRLPLVDGHGNFGSVDGDPRGDALHRGAAVGGGHGAARRHRLRHRRVRPELRRLRVRAGGPAEPPAQPARQRRQRHRGGHGDEHPPHNLGEVVDACLHLIRRPAATADELMGFVPGPDFPTGARILATSGIRDAYLTGRGAITMEAVATTENRDGGLPRIVVTEIPYQVNKATLLERMADLVRDKKVEAIRDLRDESSRDGMRIVVELKRGEDPARVLDRLYTLTDPRTNFNVNFVALVDGQPRTIGLVEALTAYLDHQREVLTRRTAFRRQRAAARAHVLEGLLVALDALDEVIAVIRAAATADEARGELMARFALTEVQATAVLDMMLRRLAALERQKLADEHRDLLAVIAELDAILADPDRLDALLAAELREVRDRHADPRRSRILPGAGVSAAAGAPGAQPTVRLEAQPVTVTVSAGGWLRSVPRRRHAAAAGSALDELVAVLSATTEDTLLLVDADGGGYRIAVGDLPVSTPRQRGTTVAQLLGDPPGAPLVGALRLSPDTEYVVTVSAAGLVKRTARGEFEGRTRSMVAAGVRDDDALVAAVGCAEGDHLILASDAGQVIRFAAADVRAMGRAAAGVTGLQVAPGARVVAVSVVPDGADDGGEVLTVAADATGKRTPLAEYPLQGRGGKGVQTGARPLAWCGVAAALHLPAEDAVAVVPAERLDPARRAAPPTTPLPGSARPVPDA